MEAVQDILLYSGNPGKVNMVIDGIYDRILIRTKTTNNKVYIFLLTRGSL